MFAIFAYDIVLADSDICAVRKRYSRIARVICAFVAVSEYSNFS